MKLKIRFTADKSNLNGLFAKHILFLSSNFHLQSKAATLPQFPGFFP